LAGDRRLDVESDPLPPESVGQRAGDRARDLDGMCDPANRQVALNRDLVSVALDRLRDEAELGVLLCVEEFGALEVPGEVRVVDSNAGDLRDTLEATVDERCVELVERAPER